MGIRHLETYMKNTVPEGCFMVNMENVIKKHKSDTQTNALIVIDLLGLIQSFQSEFEVLCGMRSDIYMDRVRSFFQRLQDTGATLVFFSDGPVQSDKEEIWFKRRDHNYDEHLEIILHFERDSTVINLLKGNVEVKPGTIVSNLLRSVAKEFGTVHIALTCECDLELAAYASVNNAFAVLADDTDFLIYTGNWRYWSIKGIEYEKFTTLEYSKSKLREHLALSMEQLPLFATLGGNDIVKYDDVKSFHYKIGNRQKFVNIANFIRRAPLSLLDDQLEKLARNVFRSGDMKLYSERIRASLESYNINSELLKCNEMDPLLRKLLVNDKNYAYGILKGLPFSITTLYDDMSQVGSKWFTQFALELHLRCVGVLLQHRNDLSLMRKVNTKMRHIEPYKQILNKPVYPPFSVPNLEALIFPEDADGLTDVRQEIFVWILSLSPQYKQQLFQLPIEFVLTVATILYLVKTTDLPIFEADVLLLSVHDLMKKKFNPDELEPPRNIIKTAFTTVFLYLKTRDFIKRILSTIGLIEFVTLIQFDGFYYHKMHQLWAVMNIEDKLLRLAEIEHLRIYAN